MAILRKPDDPCGACGERPRVTLHDDGSIRGTLHVCARALPGPPDPPRVYPKGQHWPQALSFEDAVQGVADFLGAKSVHVIRSRRADGPPLPGPLHP